MKSPALLLAVTVVLPSAWTADWPQFRGPQRTGISQETGLLKEWPKQGPKLLWQLSSIGDGYADPNGDAWADPRGMFLAEVAAGPVYKLLGKKDLGTTEFPPVGTALVSGDLAFRQHPGGHTPAPNWHYFLEFASRYLDAPHSEITGK